MSIRTGDADGPANLTGIKRERSSECVEGCWYLSATDTWDGGRERTRLLVIAYREKMRKLATYMRARPLRLSLVFYSSAR